jgi:hypothetical protein
VLPLTPHLLFFCSKKKQAKKTTAEEKIAKNDTISLKSK